MHTPTSKTCIVRIRPESIFIFSQRRTDYGDFSVVPAIRMERNNDSVLIGQTVIESLRRSQYVPGEFNLKQAVIDYKDYLKSVGFRSLASFDRNTILLHFEEKEDGIDIQLWEQQTRGFAPSTSPSVSVASESSMLGDAILQILAQVK